MEERTVKCLNPWDPQSKRQYRIDGVYAALNAGQAIGGQAHGICYAIEGNTVDRASNKNGRGWCENVSPTLNTQDRHAVIYALEGNGARPSHAGNGYSDTGQMYTLNTIEQHSVCYSLDAISSNSFKSSNPHSGIHETTVAKCLDTRCLEPSCNQGGMMICYSVDCRNLELNRERSGTLQAKENGGFSYNYLNPVLMENNDERQILGGVHRSRYSQFAICEGGCVDTLTANDFKDPCVVAYSTDPVIPAGGVYAMMEREISMMVTKNRANTLTSTDYKGAQVICHERVLHDRKPSGRQPGSD